MTVAADFVIQRPPETDDELYELTWTLTGIRIPRNSVCVEHCSPFEAFADAFFARSPVSIWKASRGFGGKSRTLAALSWMEAVVLGADISLLGASENQSKNVHDAIYEYWDSPLAPSHMLAHFGPTEMRLTNKARVRPLTASQRTVRGPHPQRLRLDEIDEMDLGILDAAMGQPMPGRGLDTQTVMSSTHQYPDKTMYEVLQRAVENDWPVFEWCWKESANPIDGWLEMETVERKKQEVSAHMWSVEYDLQEPTLGTRAMDTDSVENMFDKKKPIKSPSLRKGGMEEHHIDDYRRNADYVIAADWAKEQDFTVISVWRTDVKPWQLVHFKRGNRHPWPVMVGWYNKLLAEYHCYRAIHDGTGVGNVVNDYIDQRSTPFQMVGRDRDEMLTEYIAAVERGEFIAPRIESAYTDHKYASVESIYSRSKDEHLSDIICSFALAWHTCHRKRPRAVPINVGRTGLDGEEMHSSPWRDVGGKASHPPASNTFSFDLRI